MKKQKVQKFKTGAFRDTDTQKINIIGSFSPLVIRRFAEFMRDHNIKNGELQRDESNWKKGMPTKSYMESHARHSLDTWLTFEGYENFNIEDLLCADLFNTMGHLHEILVEKLQKKKEKSSNNKNKCPLCNNTGKPCKSCGEYHRETTSCPPHEVRMRWVKNICPECGRREEEKK